MFINTVFAGAWWWVLVVLAYKAPQFAPMEAQLVTLACALFATLHTAAAGIAYEIAKRKDGDR